MGPTSLIATWNPVYKTWAPAVTPVAEHLATPEGLVLAYDASLAQGAGQVLETGEIIIMVINLGI